MSRTPHRRLGHGESAYEVSPPPSGALLDLTLSAISCNISFIRLHRINAYIILTTTSLTLQAYFFRAKLPITDYINDTKTVLDQAPRVLNALLDIAVEMGLLDIALALTMLSKMIVQVTTLLLLLLLLLLFLPILYSTEARLPCSSPHR